MDDPDPQDGIQALLRASQKNSYGTVRNLLKRGVDPSCSDEQGHTPLHAAADRGRKKVLAVLLTAGANVDAKDESSTTPLHRAVLNGHATAASMLIGARADVNAVNQMTTTPLHVAAYYGHLDCINLLIDCGAEINVFDKWGNMPLHYAVLREHVPCVKSLLEAGPQLDAKNHDGKTALEYARGDVLEVCAPWMSPRSSSASPTSISASAEPHTGLTGTLDGVGRAPSSNADDSYFHDASSSPVSDRKEKPKQRKGRKAKKKGKKRKKKAKSKSTSAKASSGSARTAPQRSPPNLHTQAKEPLIRGDLDDGESLPLHARTKLRGGSTRRQRSHHADERSWKRTVPPTTTIAGDKASSERSTRGKGDTRRAFTASSPPRDGEDRIAHATNTDDDDECTTSSPSSSECYTTTSYHRGERHQQGETRASDHVPWTASSRNKKRVSSRPLERRFVPIGKDGATPVGKRRRRIVSVPQPIRPFDIQEMSHAAPSLSDDNIPTARRGRACAIPSVPPQMIATPYRTASHPRSSDTANDTLMELSRVVSQTARGKSKRLAHTDNQRASHEMKQRRWEWAERAVPLRQIQMAEEDSNMWFDMLSRSVESLERELEETRQTIEQYEVQTEALLNHCIDIRQISDDSTTINDLKQLQRSLALAQTELIETLARREGEEQLCLNCRARPYDVVVSPCGHMCLCSECVITMEPGRCPVCSSDIHSYMRVKRYSMGEKFYFRNDRIDLREAESGELEHPHGGGES